MKKQPGWTLPNLEDAQVRTIKEAVVGKSLFQIPGQIRLLGRGKKYHLRMYGCRASEQGSGTPTGILEEMNFTTMEHPEDADLILVNTCTIQRNAEDKVPGEIDSLRRLKRKKPGLLFRLCECMAREEDVVAKLLEVYRHVNLILGTHNTHHLPELLYDVVVSGNHSVEVLPKEGDVIRSLPVHHFGKHKVWVNIMHDCNKFCAYRIVPYARGREYSRMMEDILEEVRILKVEGFKEVMPLGQGVDSYGKDLHMEGGFAGLLKGTAKVGTEHIHFTMNHPWNFTDEIVDVIARYENIILFIRPLVQNEGSDILKIIGRRYTREQYPTLFHKIKEWIPRCAVSTNIIAGFPNETGEQFRDTLSLVDECRLDNVFTFIYSPWEGTPAASMVDNVKLAVKQRRLQELNERQNLYAREKNEEYPGSTAKVLVDGVSKKNPEVFSGYMETNKLVNFRRATAQSEDIVSVRTAACKTFSLDGEQA